MDHSLSLPDKTPAVSGAGASPAPGRPASGALGNHRVTVQPQQADGLSVRQTRRQAPHPGTAMASHGPARTAQLAACTGLAERGASSASVAAVGASPAARLPQVRECRPVVRPPSPTREGLGSPAGEGEVAGLQPGAHAGPRLGPQAQALRQSLGQRLQQFRDHLGRAWGLGQDLVSTEIQLRETESSLRQLNQSVHRASRAFMRDSELLYLQSQLDDLGKDLARYEQRLTEDFGSSLHQCGHQEADARKLLFELTAHHRQATDFATAVQSSLHGHLRRWVVRLPVLDGGGTDAYQAVNVTGRKVPGRVLQAQHAGDRPTVVDSCKRPAARYAQAPGLALSLLYERFEQPLFHALHHHLFTASELDACALARLPDADLRAVLSELFVSETDGARLRASDAERIDGYCRAIRQGGEQAVVLARIARQCAFAGMARATVAAAVAADPELLQCARNGHSVDVRLCNVSLVAPGEYEAWRAQADAFERLEAGDPVSLQVRPSGCPPVTVRARIHVSQQVLCSDTAALLTEARRSGADIRCESAGDEYPTASEGHSSTGASAVAERVSQLRAERDVLSRDLAQLAWDQDQAAGKSMHDRIDRIDRELVLLRRNAEMLRWAGQQLEGMRRNGRIWPVDDESRNRAAACLALIGYLSGETPVLSCMSGRGFTGQLDAEARFLATLTRYDVGRLPAFTPACMVSNSQCTTDRTRLAKRCAHGDPEFFSTRLLTCNFFKPPANLAHTRVEGAGNEILYSGLSHGLFSTVKFQGSSLARLGDWELRAIVGLSMDREVPSQDIEETTDIQVRAIRTNAAIAEGYAARARTLAFHFMAMQTAAAALLAADRQTYARAIAGEVVDLNLFNVCLVSPSDVSPDAITSQIQNLDALGRGRNRSSPVRLHITGPEGAQAVQCRIHTRQFPLPAHESPLALQHRARLVCELHRLLGSVSGPTLSGDLGARADALQELASVAENKARSLLTDRHRVARTKGQHQPEVRSLDGQIKRLSTEAAGYRRSARTLLDAGKQLQQRCPGLLEPNQKHADAACAAALLALIGYHMSETPILSGSSRAMLEDEVPDAIRWLGAVAHNRGGSVPAPVGGEMAFERARQTFHEHATYQKGYADSPFRQRRSTG